MFIFGEVLLKNKNLFFSLKTCYGLNITSSKKILAKLGINKNNNLNKNINIKQEVKHIDLNIIKLTEVCFNIKVFSVLKHFYNLSLKYVKSKKSYKGLRHLQCLPVRGQRTHTNAKTQKRKLQQRHLLKKKN
jgi:small subunit ribosomal protein S13